MTFYKAFEVYEHSTTNSWYEIEVYFQGKLVDRFLKPTMKEAQRDLEQAGYKQFAYFSAEA